MLTSLITRSLIGKAVDAVIQLDVQPLVNFGILEKVRGAPRTPVIPTGDSYNATAHYFVRKP